MSEFKTRLPYIVILPSGWWDDPEMTNGTQRWYGSIRGLGVCAEEEFHEDEWWLHVSFSRGDKIPSYEDAKLVKDVFVGHTRKAVMIFPPNSEHVNIHPNCLHLYCNMKQDPLPDFRRMIPGTSQKGV